MLSDSSDLQSMVGTDQMLGSELAAITLINENDYHLDSYSHLVYIVRYSAHIEMNSSLQEPIRQE